MLLSSKMLAPVVKLYVIVLICTVSASAGLVRVKRAVEGKADLKKNSYDFNSPEWSSKFLKNQIKQKDAVTFELGTPQYEILNPDEEPEIITSDQPNYYENLRLYGQVSDYHHDEYQMHDSKHKENQFEQQASVSFEQNGKNADYYEENVPTDMNNEQTAPTTQTSMKTEKPEEPVEYEEAVGSEEQTASAERVEPKEPALPTEEYARPEEHVKSVKQVNSSETASPIEPAYEVTSAKSTEIVTPLDPVKPMDSSKSAKSEKDQYAFFIVKPKPENATDVKTSEEMQEEQQASMISNLYKKFYEQQPQHQYYAGDGYLDAGDGQKIPLYDSDAESEAETETKSQYEKTAPYSNYQHEATSMKAEPQSASNSQGFAPHSYSPYASYPFSPFATFPTMYSQVGTPYINPLNYFNYNYNHGIADQPPHMRDLEHLYRSAIGFHEQYGQRPYMYPPYMYPRNKYYY